LDPQARHVLWDRLYQLKERGATQVITTHFMDEAEQLCDRLVVMDAGKIVAEGSPQGLISKYVRREVLEVRFGYGLNESMVPKVDGVGDRIEILPDRLLLYSDDGDAALSELHRREIIPESALVRRSSLEDVFLKLTGRTLVE
ncbi:MAG: lipooligosaccharide transport system ATP-binding protein, partial [Ilumatobacter sp.]